MSGIGKIQDITSPSKMFVCPNCDNYGCGDYVVGNECPFCHYPLFSNDYIYMPDFNDAYDLAILRSLENKERKMQEKGVDKVDSSGSI